MRDRTGRFATAFANAHFVYQNQTYADRGGKLPHPCSRFASLRYALIIQTKHTLTAIYPSPHALRRACGRVLLKQAVNFKNKLLVLIINKVSLKPLQRLAGSRGRALGALRRVRNSHTTRTQTSDCFQFDIV